MSTFASAAAVAERFQGEQWIALETGALAIDALVNFDARIAQTAEAGSHSIFLCDVVTVRIAPEGHAGLAYFGCKYHPVAGQNQEEAA